MIDSEKEEKNVDATQAVEIESVRNIVLWQLLKTSFLNRFSLLKYLFIPEKNIPEEENILKRFKEIALKKIQTKGKHENSLH